jgi:hypothetical protein
MVTVSLLFVVRGCLFDTVFNLVFQTADNVIKRFFFSKSNDYEFLSSISDKSSTGRGVVTWSVTVIFLRNTDVSDDQRRLARNLVWLSFSQSIGRSTVGLYLTLRILSRTGKFVEKTPFICRCRTSKRINRIDIFAIIRDETRWY